jgi:hypothetical protein
LWTLRAKQAILIFRIAFLGRKMFLTARMMRARPPFRYGNLVLIPGAEEPGMAIEPHAAQGAAPSNDLVVFGFCELGGLAFGFPPAEDFYHGVAISGHMILFAAIGSSFAIFGPAWPLLKRKFPRRWSGSFVRTAADFRFWLLALAVLAVASLMWPAVPQSSPSIAPDTKISTDAYGTAAADASAALQSKLDAANKKASSLQDALTAAEQARDSARREADASNKKYAEISPPAGIANGTSGRIISNKIEERPILKIAPDYLFKLIDGKMTGEATDLILPYIGKWMRIKSIVQDIKQSSNSGMMIISNLDVGKFVPRLMFLNFGKEYNNEITFMTKDQSFVALCQLDLVDPLEVKFVSCEFEK